MADVDRLTFTVAEVATTLGVSESTARRMVRDGEIDGVVKVRGRVLVLRAPLVRQILLATGDPDALKDESDRLREQREWEASEPARVAALDAENRKRDEDARRAYEAGPRSLGDSGGSATPSTYRLVEPPRIDDKPQSTVPPGVTHRVYT